MRPRSLMLALAAGAAAIPLVARAPAAAANQAPEHPDIGLFFQVTSDDGDVAEAALEQIAANWRDSYAIMFVDLATLLAPSDYGRRRGTEDLAAGFVAAGNETGDVRRTQESLTTRRTVDRSSLIRRRLIRFLAQQTDQGFPDDLNRWRDWIWDQPYEPHPDYTLFKGAVYGLIDERMRQFFPRAAPTEIRLDEIVWGGVIVNGIPPLDHPDHTGADDADYLKDDHLVFGIAHNGEARAYPKRIIAWHELVRDRVGGVDLTIVYCTLCGTVIPYRSVVGGSLRTLGTSGLLYRSNKLMFDEGTMSLWSTLTGTPVVGPLVGRGLELEMFPVVTTTWQEWRASHPHTTVLSLDTGFDRDYSDGAAYREYFGTDRLMFQVPELDDRLKNKAEILAIRLPPQALGTRPRPLAIAADFLAGRPVYEVEHGGHSLVVLTSGEGANRVYDAGEIRFARPVDAELVADGSGVLWRMTEQALVAEDGSSRRLVRVPAHRAFWFGWYAQFPDTELIK